MSRPPAEPTPLSRRASLALALILVALATTLGVLARGDRHVPGDMALLQAIQRVDMPGTDALVTLSNLAFSTGGALVLGAVFLIGAQLLRRPALIARFGIVVAFRVAFEVWKPIFGSPRPGLEQQPDPALVASTLGYPSGHAQTAAVIAGMLIVAAWSLDLPRTARWAAATAALLLTLLALFSRIHIGAHWPSDTLGGLLYGTAIILVAHAIVTEPGSDTELRRQPRA